MLNLRVDDDGAAAGEDECAGCRLAAERLPDPERPVPLKNPKPLRAGVMVLKES